jgi:protein-disulfide isomerase
VLGTEPQIVATYVNSGQVRLVYWPMLDHGAASQNAHAAAECIGRQSVDAFEQCYDGGDAHATVMALDRQRRDLGILTRPSFDVNGQFVAGAQSFDVFAQYIEAALQSE